MLIATYMGDVMGASSTKEGEVKVAKALGDDYSKHLNLMLGVTITQDPNTSDICISQASFFQHMFQTFNLHNLHPVSRLGDMSNEFEWVDVFYS